MKREKMFPENKTVIQYQSIYISSFLIHNCLSSSRFSRKSEAHYFTSEKANFPQNKANINIKQLFNIELNLQRPLSKKQKKASFKNRVIRNRFSSRGNVETCNLIIMFGHISGMSCWWCLASALEVTVVSPWFWQGGGAHERIFLALGVPGPLNACTLWTESVSFLRNPTLFDTHRHVRRCACRVRPGEFAPASVKLSLLGSHEAMGMLGSFVN